MKHTHYNRRALLDRLEKKYIKKVQLSAFKRESERVNRQLSAIRGVSVRHIRGRNLELLEFPDYRPTYS